MDKLKAKKEERAENEKKFEALVTLAEKQELTKEQQAELDGIETSLKTLDTEIEALEGIEERKKKLAKSKASSVVLPGAPQDDAAEEKELNAMGKRFRISKAFNQVQKNRNIDGVEKEMYDMAANEVAESGEQLSGNIAIPERFIKIGKRKAALNVGTEGTDVVFTDFGGLIPILNPTPIVESLGISIYQGLRGNVQWPRHTTDVAFSWETETSDVDETTPAFDNVSISPKRVGGYTDVTLQMLKQSAFVVEPFLRNILNKRYALTVDYAVLNGSGTGNEPTGIFNASGVGVLSTGSGSANDMTYKALLSMRRDTSVANARQGSAAWLTNSYGEFALANTPKQASGVEGNFILNVDQGKLFGERFAVSNVVKADYSEGGQTDLCGIVYSPNWQSAIFGTWGGMDILFDPYTQALGGKVRFVVNAFMDTDIEQPLEFMICKDWDASDLPALT
jgi:HK97 family phage major capsid protein